MDAYFASEGGSLVGEDAPMPAQTRYRWREDQTAEPPSVTDQWVGRKPTDRINGVNLFWALDTNLSMQRGQDARYFGKPVNSRVLWGTVVKQRDHDTLSSSRPYREVYIIPFCHVGECVDPDAGAPRLLIFQENSGSDRWQYWGFYAMPWNERGRVCAFEANGRDENDSGECYFTPARRTPFTRASIGRDWETVEATYFAGERAYDNDRVPVGNPRPECTPRVVVNDPEANPIGNVVFPCWDW